MKKQGDRKGTIHSTPPLISDHHLPFLPATILTLASALSSDDRQVLAYLISSSSVNFSNSFINHPPKTTINLQDHPVSFNCYCFRCYISYWVRWDTSPNRELIHEIIDTFEDGLLVHNSSSSSSSSSSSRREKTSKKERRKSNNRGCVNESGELKRNELSLSKDELGESESVDDTMTSGSSGGVEGCDSGGEEEDKGEEEFEKGSVMKFVSLLGERIWGVWT